ncbi:ornithine cyclodeaminase family protein [Haloarcula nitratireducens]|uniref:Ornithine cyclodeaminase family protein n=1 Tax=Haloarcula nitratireducens TaxID=2487749 RepID=A0AAW4P7E7_9EURY|nr:ornithine cyclodeaminase family protein [Halomicroarcula nitratireducens]MBX0293804.1 ornithine cyclodeaminase family protein [Halomicroarcula nitratireducens]
MPTDATALFLTSDEIADLADPADYVDPVREGYRERGEGAPAEPRTTLFNDDPAGMLTGYLAILPETGAMGGYTYAAGFGGRDAHFSLPIFDAESGDPLALIDGASMNPLKTGAAGAVGVDALARRDATDLAVIGSGTQARGQVRAAATVRDFDRIEVYSPTQDHRQSFAAEMNENLDATVAAVASSAAAVEGADVIITATNAGEPVFDGDVLEPGAHVTAMGQYHSEKRELDTTTIERATYVPDLRARVTRDAGSFIHAMEEGVVDEDDVHAELGEVVAGKESGRTSPEEVTVFDSGGTAIETVAAGKMLYDRAREAGVGEEIEFSPASEAMDGR